MKAKTELENTYGFKIKNFLDYFEVRDVTKRFLDVSAQEHKMPEKPSIPNHLSFLIRQEKGCKNIYNIPNNTNCENKYRNQWNQDLNIIRYEKTWRRVYYLCLNTILDNKSKHNMCRICKSDTETLVHLFVTCEIVRQLWSDLYNWVGHSLNKQLRQVPLKILLGYIMTDKFFLPINALIMPTKYCIFTCAMKQKAPSFNVLHLKLKWCYQEQQLLNYEKGKAEDFKRKWPGFTRMFEPETL